MSSLSNMGTVHEVAHLPCLRGLGVGHTWSSDESITILTAFYELLSYKLSISLKTSPVFLFACQHEGVSH